MELPVVLYIPNVLCYVRIILAFYGLFKSQRCEPVQAVIMFILSAILDLFDGILARVLNQTSRFGILLDIIADNILRTCGWLAAALVHTADTTTTSCSNPDTATNSDAGSSTSPLWSFVVPIVAAFFICLEWITMIATQLHANANQKHWKTQRHDDPIIVKALFANNFKNPIGILAMYGLFSSYLWTYGAVHPELYEPHRTWFEFFRYVSYVGRALSLVVELYMIKNYLCLIIEKDAKVE